VESASASEDFGSFGTEWHVPSVFWFVGGTDPGRYAKAKQAGRLNEIPTNHNPAFRQSSIRPCRPGSRR
jgi:hippurate hydrolase